MLLHLHIFLIFPHKQPLASLRQTRQKKFTSSHTFPPHLQAFSSYTVLPHTPLLSLSGLPFSKPAQLCVLTQSKLLSPACPPIAHLCPHLPDPLPFSLAPSLHPFFKRLFFLLHHPELSPATHPSYSLGKAYMSKEYLCHFHQPQPHLPPVTSLM